MVPEAVAAMLACARIGAIHNVVFGGFSAESVKERMQFSDAKVLVTADATLRRGEPTPMKSAVDAVAGELDTLEHIVVVDRCGTDPPMTEGRDVFWHDAVADADPECPPEPMDAEDPLFILYTSGSTAKPKGILHTTGGYLTHVSATHKLVFDHKDDDVYWCGADIGWVTGHSYIVYGPLANGATSVLYEGAPNYPTEDRWWEIVERYGVTIFYTAPTAIRACMKWGTEHPEAHDLSSLRLLGSVGEPINPRAWLWYHENIGGGRCPIVDTWWQTETGGIMITPLPGLTTTKPGSATIPFPGIEAKIFDSEGNEIEEGGGNLVLTRPWPGMARTLYKERERFIETYWERYGRDTYLVGDAARRDEDGYFWIVGRIDDVINVSGHRLSTMEVESALVSHPKVAEAAVIGQADEDTGQAIVAFVTLEGGNEPSDEMVAELREHVAQKIGKLARPKRIIWADDLPKTRSGKIMRRLLRDIASGDALGDVTTLRDPTVMDALKKKRRGRAGEGGLAARGAACACAALALAGALAGLVVAVAGDLGAAALDRRRELLGVRGAVGVVAARRRPAPGRASATARPRPPPRRVAARAASGPRSAGPSREEDEHPEHAEEQDRDAERHPEAAPEARQQADPHRVQRRVDDRDDEPERARRSAGPGRSPKAISPWSRSSA